MKTKILIISLSFVITTQTQTIYDVQPGTKGNQINLTVSNISKTTTASNVKMVLVKNSEFLSFNNNEAEIEKIKPGNEGTTTFIFDINRNTQVNKKDTIDFMITDMNGTTIMKSFILNYTPPKEFKLEQNFPNPFNPTTTIQYQLPKDSKVTLIVYDILGSEVVALVNEKQEAGYKEVKFNATNFASGVYIYRLITTSVTGTFVDTKKMMVLK